MKKIIKINKNNNINNSNEKLLFQKFRKNRKNVVINNNDDDNNHKEKISLFEDKILNKILEENIRIKQDIEIKKSIIHNEFKILKLKTQD